MNENLKKLINQSSREWNETFDEYPELHFDQKKFAELIIQECDNVLTAKAEGRMIGDEVDVGGILRNHFGVK